MPIERAVPSLDPEAEEALLHAFHVAEVTLLSELLELVEDDELAELRDLRAYRQMLSEYLTESRRQASVCTAGAMCHRRPLLARFEETSAEFSRARYKVRLKRKRQRASSDEEPEPSLRTP